MIDAALTSTSVEYMWTIRQMYQEFYVHIYVLLRICTYIENMVMIPIKASITQYQIQLRGIDKKKFEEQHHFAP